MTKCHEVCLESSSLYSHISSKAGHFFYGQIVPCNVPTFKLLFVLFIFRPERRFVLY